MKINGFIVASVSACLVSVASSTNADNLTLGDKIPMAATKMQNVDGKQVSIADVAGKNGTLVVFSCNHCPFAKAWEGRMVAIGNASAKRGVGAITINSNDPASYPEDSMEVMQQHARDKGYQFPYVVDGTSDVARAFGATHTPEVFLFDKEGKLVYHGAIDDDSVASKVTKNFLNDALAALVEGKPISVSETKAIGCTIKYRSKT